MDARHTAAHVEHFERHGWVLIPSLLTEVRDRRGASRPLRALSAAGGLPRRARRPAQRGVSQGADAPANQGDDPRFRPQQFVGLKEFPHPDQTLNLLALHPAIIAVAEDVLKTRDVRLYQAETFAKYSGVTQYDQPFHVDYTNHTMLPPRADGRWRQAQMFLFLSDVTAAHGATRIVSRELTRECR